jgi:hypothetical protein
MRRKALQDVANTVCAMLVGWRMGQDLEILAELPDGTLEFDLIEQTATHSVVGPVRLHIAAEIGAWLIWRLKDLAIPVDALRTARLRAQIRTDRIATNRKRIVSFDWTCESEISTDEKRYLGRLVEKHIWHKRTTT